MTATIPLKEPEVITIGDTVKWRVKENDYLPDTWALTYALVSADQRIEITATNNSDGTHLVNVTAVTSANWLPGNYYYQAYATYNSERFMLRKGYVEIVENFADMSAGLDARSHTKIVLDALEAMMEGKASKDQSGYSIAGRSLQRMSPNEIIQWYDHYKQKWARELADLRSTRDQASGRKVKAQF